MGPADRQPGSVARLAQCSSMHVVGPPSAAGSAFYTVGLIPVQRNVRARNTAVKRCSRVLQFQKILSRGALAPSSRWHDEATRRWFDQADRRRLVRSGSGSSAAAGTRVVEVANSNATDTSIVRFESIGGVRRLPGERQTSIRGATCGQRVTSGRTQVQHAAGLSVARFTACRSFTRVAAGLSPASRRAQYSRFGEAVD